MSIDPETGLEVVEPVQTEEPVEIPYPFYERLTAEQLEKMSAPEIRAAGVSRDYAMGDGGGQKASARRFKEAQDADTKLPVEEVPPVVP